MRVLSIDTSTSLVLGFLGDKEFVRTGNNHKNDQSVNPQSMGSTHTLNGSKQWGSDQIFKLLADIEPAELIVVGIGPGSYTGLRIGASVALGLARAWSSEIIGVPSFEAIAAENFGTVAVSLDARQNNVYCALYSVDQLEVKEISVLAKRKQEEFAEIAAKADIYYKNKTPNGLILARLGLKRYKNGIKGLNELLYL